MTLTTEMNTLQILNVLKNDPFAKSVFTDVLPSDRLPSQIRKRPKGFILNVDPSNGQGSHWIAVYLTEDGKGEFFDSFGERPEFYSRTFKTFLQDHSSTFTWNENTLQSPWSRVCGQYCLFYALHRSRNIPMSTIVNMFTDHKDRNDTLVRNFIRKWYFV